jgi:alginate O-acetyltransferase complex protein AlgI
MKCASLCVSVTLEVSRKSNGVISMVFSSLTFLFLFLPLNLVLYFMWAGKTWRNWILIVFSLAFYAWGEPVWITLLIFSASIDYFHGRLIQNYRQHWIGKAALSSSIVLNLSLLGFFKYSAFLLNNLNALFGINLAVVTFGLPIGISFYTFQTMSYVITGKFMSLIPGSILDSWQNTPFLIRLMKCSS